MYGGTVYITDISCVPFYDEVGPYIIQALHFSRRWKQKVVIYWTNHVSYGEIAVWKHLMFIYWHIVYIHTWKQNPALFVTNYVLYLFREDELYKYINTYTHVLHIKHNYKCIFLITQTSDYSWNYFLYILPRAYFTNIVQTGPGGPWQRWI